MIIARFIFGFDKCKPRKICRWNNRGRYVAPTIDREIKWPWGPGEIDYRSGRGYSSTLRRIIMIASVIRAVITLPGGGVHRRGRDAMHHEKKPDPREGRNQPTSSYGVLGARARQLWLQPVPRVFPLFLLSVRCRRPSCTRGTLSRRAQETPAVATSCRENAAEIFQGRWKRPEPSKAVLNQLDQRVTRPHFLPIAPLRRDNARFYQRDTHNTRFFISPWEGPPACIYVAAYSRAIARNLWHARFQA